MNARSPSSRWLPRVLLLNKGSNVVPTLHSAGLDILRGMIPLLIAVSLVQLLADSVYVRNTLLGRSQPNRVTFFLGAAVPMIAVAIGIFIGETWSLLPIFMVGFGPFLIFIASFFNPKAYWKLGAFDYVSGALAVVALVLWWLTKEPAVAVVFAILSDWFVWLPTLIKAWRYPETETGIGYAIAVVNAAIGVTILQAYDFTHSGFLIYTVFINLCLTIAVYRKSPFQKVRREHSFIREDSK